MYYKKKGEKEKMRCDVCKRNFNIIDIEICEFCYCNLCPDCQIVKYNKEGTYITAIVCIDCAELLKKSRCL